jgi:hypothetical protein
MRHWKIPLLLLRQGMGMLLGLFLLTTLAGAGEPALRLAQASPEAQLQRLYDDFRAALLVKDIERALQAIVPGYRDRYRELFTGFGDLLPEVARTMPPLDRITVHGDRGHGEGRMPPPAPGAKPEPPIEVSFRQGPTGTWYIEGF